MEFLKHTDFCPYTCPVGLTTYQLGKRVWKLVERQKPHPDLLLFHETNPGSSPEISRWMHPSEESCSFSFPSYLRAVGPNRGIVITELKNNLCPHGHEDFRIRKNGSRFCVTCAKIRQQKKFVPKRIPLHERFWNKVNKTEDQESCWEWRGAKSDRGYGFFRLFGRQERASRVSLFLSSGVSVPRDMMALHRCDNPSCVNPSHLFIGTAQDNMVDMVKKGRGPKISEPRPLKSKCKHGHPYPENARRVIVKGKYHTVICTKCLGDGSKKHRAKKKLGKII